MAKGQYKEWRKEENLIRLRGWAMDGLTDDQIAHNIGISRSTLSEWKNRFSDIADSLKKGKEVADYEVENALYMKALGFYTEIMKPYKVKKVVYDEKTGRKLKEYEEIEYAKEEVYVPPDTTAMIFWLKNRKPQVWRDKVENYQTESGEAAGVIEIPMVQDNE
jgi:transcriptional regulator with XRE-family HTH domain